MRIIILTSYTVPNIYLVNHLMDKKNIVGKVIERRPLPTTSAEKWDIRKRMAKKYGMLKTINKLLFNKYRHHFINQNHENIIKHLLFPNSEVDYTKDITTIEVGNINEESCKEFIIEHNPDVIAVCGTTVIKPEVFKLASKGTINIHCGLTPEYRSADPIFWALYNNELDKVGVTIHYVDAGVDTGSILHQEAVGVTRDDNLATLYCKCIKTGAALIAKALDDIERDDVRIIRKENVAGKSYYHMDLGICQYFQFQRRFRKLKSHLS